MGTKPLSKVWPGSIKYPEFHDRSTKEKGVKEQVGLLTDKHITSVSTQSGNLWLLSIGDAFLELLNNPHIPPSYLPCISRGKKEIE